MNCVVRSQVCTLNIVASIIEVEGSPYQFGRFTDLGLSEYRIHCNTALSYSWCITQVETRDIKSSGYSDDRRRNN
jgi:hypothetical protein